MRRQCMRHRVHGAGGAGTGKASNVIRKPRDAESWMSAYIDPLEWLQIERYVERQSVITRAPANPQSHAREFGAIDIHPRVSARALRRHAELSNAGNDGILERHHQFAHAQGAAPQVNER